jgi:hypothetical protein
MSEELRFRPPVLDFDPVLANALARFPATTPAAEDEPLPIVDRRNPLNGYARTLTARGGVLIQYKDQDRSLFLTTLRIYTGIMVTIGGGWLIFVMSALSALQCLLAFALLTLVTWIVAWLPIEVSHSVEIHPDGMIIDGELFFSADSIGDNWPSLEMIEDDPDRMVLCGICGTRFIEYATANRIRENDRTPEVLAADLENIMEQLWGRRDAIFSEGPSIFNRDR